MPCCHGHARPKYLKAAGLVAGLLVASGCGGAGTSGSPAAPTPIVSAPSAPTAVRAVVGDTQAQVSFDPPASNGGAPITAYTVTANPGGTSAVGTASPITVTGLVNGTPYSFTVTATNSTGTGVASAPSDPATPTVPISEAPPTLAVSIVDLSGAYDAATGRLGSLDCTFRFATDPNDRWCFGVFGKSVSGSRVSPSYDYKVAASATVRAVAAGVVTRLEAETNPLYPGEFEVETRSVAGGTYQVIYDHVRNVAVAMGSVVTPGMPLGIAGIHTSNAATWGRVELQINRITQRSPSITTVAVCPRAFGTAAFNAEQEKALAAHNVANPAFAAAAVCAADSVP